MVTRAQIKAKEQAIKNAGGGAALARLLGLRSRQAVYMWDRVPAEHVLKIERITGVARHKLRPDLYPDPATELAEAS
jgi:DNA-binding transcriptional regulator YdaS (Cro superfamily)